MENRAPNRVLVLYGGWKGHSPKKFADYTRDTLLCNYEVVCTQDLRMLHRSTLSEFDLILPIWTFGKITVRQEKDLLESVADGLGYVGWHGNASSFLECRPHKFMLGGQFVGHPGGNEINYTVRFCSDDPIVKGLKNIRVTSEQYYLLTDPAVKVLANCRVHGGHMYWVKGVEMPVVWKRRWGKGRVFYCALGHTVDVLQHPTVTELLSRAIAWAHRKSEMKF